MVGGVPTIANIGRVGGEHDRGLEFASMHVVVVATADTGSTARCRPVFTARIQPDAHRTVGVGALYHIGEYVVTAVTIHHDHGGNTLLCEGCTDVGYDGGQRGWAEADRSGKR
jgi:hypothetical protein